MAKLAPAPPWPPEVALEAAEQAAKSSALSFSALDMQAIRILGQTAPADMRRWASALADAVTAASLTRTIEGASTLQVTFDCPWPYELLNSAVLDEANNGVLDSIQLPIDTLMWRLVKVEKQQEELLFTFEEEAVALLRQHRRKLSVSRATSTRAEFIARMVREVKFRQIPFVIPELHDQQPTTSARVSEQAHDAHRRPGFAPNVKLKVKGATADPSQLQEMTAVLRVCDEENATGNARLGIVTAAIGESQFRKSATNPRSNARGVFQLLPGTARILGLDPADTTGTARHFLRTGYYGGPYRGVTGYGGAIHAADSQPGWDAGDIASAVEGSDKDGSFYRPWIPEARAIVDAWGGGSSGSSRMTEVGKQYLFTRGLPGKTETSWDAIQRLAEEVGRRCFVVAGVLYYGTEDWLYESRARAVLNPRSLGVTNVDFDIDLGKTVQQVKLTADVSRWSFPPGSVIALEGLGPANGHWLINTIERQDAFDPSTEITLTKPMAPKNEPATTLISVPDHPGAVKGAARTIAWAKSKLGHYKENFGPNLGEELNRLEQHFGLQGAPWCAMFATTAVAQGVTDPNCTTASVAQILAWANAGTHGYEKGARRTPRPGDLLCLGTEHVALVVRVHGDSVDTIEGNTSADQVARSTRLTASGTLVRPDYVTS